MAAASGVATAADRVTTAAPAAVGLRRGAARARAKGEQGRDGQHRQRRPDGVNVDRLELTQVMTTSCKLKY
jgi:hypothetical protein